MKRFYKAVTVVRGETGFEIHLDGRPVRTPGRIILAASSDALAYAIMAEWAAQVDAVDPETMPLTQLLTTALERVARDRPAMTDMLCAYLDTDLLCYRAPQETMAARQKAAWDPWLAWFERAYGARLEVTTSLKALSQPEMALKVVRMGLDAMDDEVFTVAQLVVSLTGSLVLGLGFARGDLGADEAFRVATVEEAYKSAIYRDDLHGEDPHQKSRHDTMRRDLVAAEKFLGFAHRR